jgi:hypothetical protein
MEVIINIIVTIAVILYVLRRMQEVARKGGEITGPPPPARMFCEDEEEEREEAPSRPVRRSPETTQMPGPMEVPFPRPRTVMQAPEPPPSRKFTVPEEPPRPRPYAVPEVRRPEHRHYQAPAEAAPSREGRIREAVREDEEGRYRETGPAFRPGPRPKHLTHPSEPVFQEPAGLAPEARQHRRRERGAPRPALAFGGNDVVRGIIMSENLGPPVSMRREMPR